jgi:hypothetical protein
VAGEVLAEDDPGQRIAHVDRRQPRGVMLGLPGVARPVVDQPAAQQQLADPMSRRHQVPAQIFASAN